jgi:succinate dehydrogenase / fumarate reductase cytochrome b subunit
MATATRPPRPYRPGLWTRLAEGLRSPYGVGQWSWLLHRVTGLGVLAFLIVHILDTFFVVAYPGLYDHTLSLYSGRVPWALDAQGQPTYYWPIRWAFRLGELALIACVVFHAVNGVRVALVDLWVEGTRYQKAMFGWVVGVFAVLMLIAAFFVFRPLLKEPEFWNFPGESPALPAGDVTGRDT